MEHIERKARMLVYAALVSLTILWTISAIKIQDLIEAYKMLERDVSKALAEIKASELRNIEIYNEIKSELNVLYKRTAKTRSKKDVK